MQDVRLPLPAFHRRKPRLLSEDPIRRKCKYLPLFDICWYQCSLVAWLPSRCFRSWHFCKRVLKGAEVSCFLLPGYPWVNPWVNFSQNSWNKKDHVEAGPPLIQLPMLFPFPLQMQSVYIGLKMMHNARIGNARIGTTSLSHSDPAEKTW